MTGFTAFPNTTPTSSLGSNFSPTTTLAEDACNTLLPSHSLHSHPTQFDPRFPSLTPDAIQTLTALVANDGPNPAPQVLKLWVALLALRGAKEQDVINWILYRNQEQQLQHLPTQPDTGTSMTPEPSSTSQSPAQGAFPELYNQEAITSPAMPASQLPFHEQAQATPPEPEPEPEPLSTLLPLVPSNNDPMLLQPNQYSHVPGLKAIIHGVRDALASSQTTPTTAAPKTAAEFDAMFFPFEQRISLLLLAFESV